MVSPVSLVTGDFLLLACCNRNFWSEAVERGILARVKLNGSSFVLQFSPTTLAEASSCQKSQNLMAGSLMTVELEIWLQCIIYWKFRVNVIEIQQIWLDTFDIFHTSIWIIFFNTAIIKTSMISWVLMHAALDGEVHAQVPRELSARDWNKLSVRMELFGLLDGHSTSMIQNGSMFQSQSFACVCVEELWTIIRGFAHWAEPMYDSMRHEICGMRHSRRRKELPSIALYNIDSTVRAAKETHHLADCQSASPASMVFFKAAIDHMERLKGWNMILQTRIGSSRRSAEQCISDRKKWKPFAFPCSKGIQMHPVLEICWNSIPAKALSKKALVPCASSRGFKVVLHYLAWAAVVKIFQKRTALKVF